MQEYLIYSFSSASSPAGFPPSVAAPTSTTAASSTFARPSSSTSASASASSVSSSGWSFVSLGLSNKPFLILFLDGFGFVIFKVQSFCFWGLILFPTMSEFSPLKEIASRSLHISLVLNLTHFRNAQP